jgi:hypothetical protein
MGPRLLIPVYAQVSDQEVLRDYRPVLGPGAVIAGPAAVELRDGALPDSWVDWLKTNFFTTELELGRCLRLAAEGPCECDLNLTCTKFVATPEYAPLLRARREVEETLTLHAAARGWDRELGPGRASPPGTTRPLSGSSARLLAWKLPSMRGTPWNLPPGTATGSSYSAPATAPSSSTAATAPAPSRCSRWTTWIRRGRAGPRRRRATRRPGVRRHLDLATFRAPDGNIPSLGARMA